MPEAFSYHKSLPSVKDGAITRKLNPLCSVTLSKRQASQIILSLYNIFIYFILGYIMHVSHHCTEDGGENCTFVTDTIEEHRKALFSACQEEQLLQGHHCLHTENHSHPSRGSSLCVLSHKNSCIPAVLRLDLYQP